MFRMREKGGLSTLMPLIVVASFVFLSTDARASQVQPPAELRLLPGSAHPPTIALWLFDEDANSAPRSLLEDWSVRGLDLTLGPGARLTKGRFGNALDILASGGRAAYRRSIDRTPLNLGPFDWTWETWVLMKAIAQPGAVLFEARQGPFEAGPISGLRLGSEQDRLVFICEAAGFDPVDIPTVADVFRAADDKWHHLALVYEVEKKTLTHYVDGQPTGAVTLPAALMSLALNGENSFSIGADMNGWHGLPAILDETRFSESARYTSVFTPPESLAPRRDLLVLGKGPHLFIDESLIAESEGLERVTHQPERLLEPVIPQRTIRDGWEQQAGGATFLYYADEKKFRAWMSVKNVGLAPEEFYAVTYWESLDGLNWTAPDLGLFEVGGSIHHNIVMTAGRHNFRFHSDSVIDLGPNTTDSAKRFQLAYFPYDWKDDNTRGMNVAFSPDGIHWTPYEGNPVLRHWEVMIHHPDAATTVADITDVYYDSDLALYVLNYKTYALPYEYPLAAQQRTPRWREINDVVSGYRRLTGQATSKDFVHWENLQRVMVPDDRDAPELQFYAMSILKRGDLYVGHVRCLDDQAELDGIGWMELATSRDLYHWTRHRDVFLNRNPQPDSWDHSICWSDRPTIVGNKFYFYYTGLSAGHKIGTRSKGLALLRKDGYVSRKAGPANGRLKTIEISLPLQPGMRLALNAKTFDDGLIRVALLDANSRPLVGYSTDDCSPVQGDSVSLPVRWSSEEEFPDLSKTPIRLQFEMRNAEVYGFEVLEK